MTRVLAKFLFEVRTTDPGTFIAELNAIMRDIVREHPSSYNRDAKVGVVPISPSDGTNTPPRGLRLAAKRVANSAMNCPTVPC